MAVGDFVRAEARGRVERAVTAVERQTSAEVVVAVHPRSGSYRDVDYLFGAGLALAVLCALLFLPQPFPLWHFPIDVAAAFGLGAALSATASPLGRLLTTSARRRRQARSAAHASFQEMGVSLTSQRTGILVYVSLFERDCVVVADAGVDVESMGSAWRRAVQRLRSAVAEGDVERFVEALEALGPLLARFHERGEDDVNELPDEVRAA